jgi:uncharacterized membrane protein
MASKRGAVSMTEEGARFRRKIRPMGVLIGLGLVVLGGWLSWKSQGYPSKGEDMAVIMFGTVELVFGSTKRVPVSAGRRE